MGATTFMTEAAGKTAQEAFGAARERALYDYGHRGYTGTIAEKGDFVMIRDKPEQVAERVRKVEWMNEEARMRRAEQVLTKRDAHSIAQALLDADDPRVADKWGPAGCIEIEPGRYLFFGWASE